MTPGEPSPQEQVRRLQEITLVSNERVYAGWRNTYRFSFCYSVVATPWLLAEASVLEAAGKDFGSPLFLAGVCVCVMVLLMRKDARLRVARRLVDEAKAREEGAHGR